VIASIMSECRELFQVGGWVLAALFVLGFGIVWCLVDLAQRIGEATTDETQARVRRRFDFTFMLIGVAPLLGLLGTVTGMFATFDGMAAPGSGTPISVISRGVSEALLTTQTGLVIAVPSFIACALLRASFQRAHQMEAPHA